MDWTDIAKGNDMWWAVDRKCLMNSGFERMRGMPWLAEKLAACQEWLSHGVSQSESELYEAVAINCDICKHKVFITQLKLKSAKHLSCYVEGTAQCLISHVTFWANLSFSDPQTGSSLRKTKTARKVRSCSMNSCIQTDTEQLHTDRHWTAAYRQTLNSCIQTDTEQLHTDRHWTPAAGQMHWICTVRVWKLHYIVRSCECGNGVWVATDRIIVQEISNCKRLNKTLHRTHRPVCTADLQLVLFTLYRNKIIFKIRRCSIMERWIGK